ncbi:MAG: hypothetical protein K2F94_04245, partial [Muribaculaceae bacterium]|nr:hypothetical protein [Muribaculaceae bacterium]
MAFIGLAAAGSAQKPDVNTVRTDETAADSSAVAGISYPDSIPAAPGSTPVSNDSLPEDSTYKARRGEPLPEDSTRTVLSRINRNKADLESAVTFSAKDSLVMVGQNNTYLYGDGDVEYGSFKLKSQEIRMELDKSTVYASGALDSTGNLVGNPVFNDGGEEYESKEMSYNFKTEKGFIQNVITEQGDGYLIGGASKKMDDGTFFFENGKYTTCDNHDHPHFYFNLTRGKMRPNKDVTTGPGYMVLADVP